MDVQVLCGSFVSVTESQPHAMHAVSLHRMDHSQEETKEETQMSLEVSHMMMMTTTMMMMMIE